MATKSRGAEIVPANYGQHLEWLRGCDLVIEAIAERMDWKHDLYAKIAPFLAPHAIFASNTSGLPIRDLAQGLPEAVHARFCGVHFFNPPRYMHLAELIPIAATDPRVLDALEGFLTTTLGKGVVRAKDTPNFIGNRDRRVLDAVDHAPTRRRSASASTWWMRSPVPRSADRRAPPTAPPTWSASTPWVT